LALGKYTDQAQDTMRKVAAEVSEKYKN